MKPWRTTECEGLRHVPLRVNGVRPVSQEWGGVGVAHGILSRSSSVEARRIAGITETPAPVEESIIYSARIQDLSLCFSRGCTPRWWAQGSPVSNAGVIWLPEKGAGVRRPRPGPGLAKASNTRAEQQPPDCNERQYGRAVRDDGAPNVAAVLERLGSWERLFLSGFGGPQHEPSRMW